MGARAATPAGERPSFLGTTCPRLPWLLDSYGSTMRIISYSVACLALSISSRLVISFFNLTFYASFLGPIILGRPGTTYRKLISWWSDFREPLGPLPAQT